MIKRICEFCKKELKFDNGWQFGAHKVNCEFYPHRARRIKRCNKSNIKPRKIYRLQCLKCSSKYQLELTEYKFSNGKYSKYCSSQCAKSRVWSEEYKKALSKKMKGYHFGNRVLTFAGITYETRTCSNPTCKKEFEIEPWKKPKYCSVKCGSRNNGGLRFNAGKHGSWYYCKYLDKEVYLDSTWELELATHLDNQHIVWSRGISYKWVDASKKEHKYYPDFVLIKEKRILDVKNRYLEVRDADKITRVMKQNNIVVEIINRSMLDEILAGVV